MELDLFEKIQSAILNQDNLDLAKLLRRLGDGLDHPARFAAEAVRMTCDPDREDVEEFIAKLRSDYPRQQQGDTK